MTNETALKLERGQLLTPEEIATLSPKAQAAYADSLADEAAYQSKVKKWKQTNEY